MLFIWKDSFSKEADYFYSMSRVPGGGELSLSACPGGGE